MYACMSVCVYACMRVWVVTADERLHVLVVACMHFGLQGLYAFFFIFVVSLLSSQTDIVE